MVVICHTSVHFILGVALLNWAQHHLWFWQNCRFLSYDSQIIAIYAEVLKYTVKFNMPEKIILKVMIPNFFCPV